MKRLLIFDEEGFYIEDEIVHDWVRPIENQYIVNLDEEISFYKPKLVDGEIVEGKTEEEFLEELLMSALIPSQKELEEADFEIKIITLLTELEVI